MMLSGYRKRLELAMNEAEGVVASGSLAVYLIAS
jgi:hypothetical protein